MRKILISFGIFCFSGLFFVLINPIEWLDHKQLSKEETIVENELLAFLNIIIVEELRDIDEVKEIKSDYKSIIINTSINSLDTKKQIELTDQIFSKLKIMNKRNGIDEVINYTVLLETEDGIVVGEIKFGDYLPY
ncbi:hypothetical protein [Paenisporosarcina antarctica]|uniref:Uncharacterized protein n=1 Tax=Paenisporosarcina antarctica TaxID=417367 RepID=A0A4P6ZXM3_9BACL|nr:hypothetical protein [Paenisporosarcina antarctica]QBP41024.1 hypothetical protein E2636_07765 [Paenisporosarcina antarctica]